MTANPQITFVCCIESGTLETQTVRMVESLRRWGGQFADAPLIAVTPRFGSPLLPKTRQAFEQLQVKYLSFQAESRYSWFGFMNKPNALVAAQENSKSEFICWLDSDILILGQPDKLILNQGEDFLACSTDDDGATSGPDHPCEPYWKEVCQLAGIDLENFPWVTTEREGRRIRLYWNSGVFVYRRSTDFANHYLQTCINLLDAHVSIKNKGIFYTDQVSLALTAMKMGVSWRGLPHSHNYHMHSLIHTDWYKREELQTAKILHYHDCMGSHFWSEFLKCLRVTHPSVAEWLSPLGALKNESPVQWRVTNSLLKRLRSRRQSTYEQLCRVI
jgi:hypothetical protein